MKPIRLLLALSIGIAPVSAFATAYTDEALWRAAVGGVYALETFDAIATGSDVTSLPALGISFDALNDGTQPTVQPYSSTGGVPKTGPNNLLNDRDFALPARGPYTMRPINAGDFLFGLGLWNVGGDDTLRLSFYDAADSLIEQVTSATSQGFFGIVNAAGAKRAVVDFVGGNGYAPVDDLQTATRPTFNGVPEPTTAALTLVGLLALGAWRRRRSA